MVRKQHATLLVIGALIVSCSLLYRCGSHKFRVTNSLNFTTSPVISAGQSIDRMQTEPGFEVRLVAAEPLISAPVAISFDNKGRLWAIEMNGYMPDTLGTGEDIPSGKVVILTDNDHDGRYDQRTVFLESLLLPRALCLIDNGILVAEPPNLWFYPIKDDKPGKRILVDPTYTTAGNVEHQPNGLLRALDNWIYNAKSTKRYRKVADKWLVERTHFRGQWGLSQDNAGRLYYNDNSSNVSGDYFLPGFGANNTDQKNISGFSETVVADTRVYPARPTPGINRGYTPGMLDDSSRLINFTAACSPLVYRGGLFGRHEQDVFVAEPSANLVKRNIIIENGFVTRGKQAYQGREFLASTDERFRPVNLNDGPDGALYITDMYRGIIQHKTYLTGYLKNQIAERDLSLPLQCGRIYKVLPKGHRTTYVDIPKDAKALTALLGSTNGWLRDRAQQTIIDKKMTGAIPALQQILNGNNRLHITHALWTLEGLHALNDAQVLSLLQRTDPWLRVQALAVIPSIISKSSYKMYLAALQTMLTVSDQAVVPYLAFLCPTLARYDRPAADKLRKALAEQFANDKFVADAIISGLSGGEVPFIAAIADTSTVFAKHLKQVSINRADRLTHLDPKTLKEQFPRGVQIFNSTCQTCHGADGGGIKGLAPPLNRSQWITGDKRKLIAIVLSGLTGPVAVNDHVYTSPEINGDMPGIGGAKEISDEAIAQLLTFLRRSWQNSASTINEKDVSTVRNQLKGRDKAFTTQELLKLYSLTTE